MTGGYGETIELAGRHLQSHQVQHMTVANRTLARAQELASQWQADVITLNEIPTMLPDVDVVVSSTASPLPLLGKGLIERVEQQGHKPMLLIDLRCRETSRRRWARWPMPTSTRSMICRG